MKTRFVASAQIVFARCRTLIKRLLWSVGALCIISVIPSMIASNQWWLRIFDYPRQQFTLISLLVLLAAGFALKWESLQTKLFLALLGLAVVYQIGLLMPYTVVYPKAIATASATETTFSLLVSNVKMANRQADRYLALIHQSDPDLILVIEPDAWWQQQLQSLHATHPFSVEHPRNNHFGMSLYSQIPLQDSAINYFDSRSNAPSLYTVLVFPAGQQVILHGIHPRTPLPGVSQDLADEEILRMARFAQAAQRPVIVAGDFNDVPWSHTMGQFKQISGMDDPRIGRGFYNTFSAYNRLLRYPIDHAYFSHQLQLVRFERLPPFGSDHFALLVTLALAE
ncbi:MAG: endonuclease/exonuclease/phosphatase family protein [Chloroflexota bacterium]|nr:endonuclease/exonuclease/phosphatase family protein [Chloroflexota bacterium]